MQAYQFNRVTSSKTSTFRARHATERLSGVKYSQLWILGVSNAASEIGIKRQVDRIMMELKEDTHDDDPWNGCKLARIL